MSDREEVTKLKQQPKWESVVEAERVRRVTFIECHCDVKCLLFLATGGLW